MAWTPADVRRARKAPDKHPKLVNELGRYLGLLVTGAYLNHDIAKEEFCAPCRDSMEGPLPELEPTWSACLEEWRDLYLVYAVRELMRKRYGARLVGAFDMMGDTMQRVPDVLAEMGAPRREWRLQQPISLWLGWMDDALVAVREDGTKLEPLHRAMEGHDPLTAEQVESFERITAFVDTMLYHSPSSPAFHDADFPDLDTHGLELLAHLSWVEDSSPPLADYYLRMSQRLLMREEKGIGSK